MRENYEEKLKFSEDKQCESSAPMKTDKIKNSVIDAENHMKDRLKNKKETTSVGFERKEDNNYWKNG